MRSEKITVKPLDADGEKRVIEFLNHDEVGITETVWSWKYSKENGTPMHGVAVNHENEIVGHTGSVYTKLSVLGKDVFAYRSEDIKVRKDYRRQGIGLRLAQAAAASAVKNRAIIYGFPSAAMQEIVFKKIGAKNCGTINCYIKPLFFGKSDSGFSVRKSNEPEKDSDLVWKGFQKNHKVCVARDSKYFKWRFLDKPKNNYAIFFAYKKNETIGYIVAEKRGFGLSVEDICVNDSNAINPLIEKARKSFNEKIFWASGHFSETNFVAELQKKGFFRFPGNGFALSMFFPEETPEAVQDCSNWFITRSDIQLRHD